MDTYPCAVVVENSTYFVSDNFLSNQQSARDYISEILRHKQIICIKNIYT